MDWRVLAVSVPLLFVSFQSLSKLLPKSTSIFLINAYASLIAFIFMIALHFITASDKSLKLSSKNLLLAAAIGLLIGFGNYGVIKAYSLGAPQTAFTLIFYVSLIIYGVIFGLLFWQEKINFIQGIGGILAI